jgi:hypothetical protein
MVVTPVILALERLRQEDWESEASLHNELEANLATQCDFVSKNKTNKQKTKAVS